MGDYYYIRPKSDLPNSKSYSLIWDYSRKQLLAQEFPSCAVYIINATPR